LKGWNPETKELITGEATAKDSPLGDSNFASTASGFGDQTLYISDLPVHSAEEAKVIAEAKLQDAGLQFITGEAEITGDPDMDLGKIVKISPNSDPNADPGEDPFNGKYFIIGLTHRHTQSKSKDGGYTTHLRLARDAAKSSS